VQRPIKFRAWDKDSKRMHYAEDLIGPGGWVIQFHGVPLEIGIHGVFEPENVELMQYTGLEDKNGKEIYEGDIVRTTLISLGFWRVRSRQLTDEVVYQPGAFTIGHGNAAHLISPYRDDLEVIGNIQRAARASGGRQVMATQSPAHIRHLNGEHSRWCQKIKGKLIYCRFTDQRIGKVGK
jgi:uncharacterized phage protein (TIGR01671 family)